MTGRRFARSLFCLFTLGSICLRSAGSARADEGLVAVRFTHCDAVAVDAVRSRLAVELPGASRRQGAPAPTVVQVDCDATSLRLSVEDALTGKVLARVVALPAVEPDVKARTVAIAIAELVAASWSELETNPSPRVPAIGATPSSSAVADAVDALRRRPRGLAGGQLRLTAVASTQLFFRSNLALVGAGVRLAANPGRFVGWSVDLIEHHGTAHTALGDVAIDTITASGAALAQRSWTHFGIDGGLGLRIGASVLRGQAPASATTQSGHVVWAAGGPLATLGLHVIPVRDLVLDLAAEAGYWLFPTAGLVSGSAPVTLRGPWAGVELGVGLFL